MAGSLITRFKPSPSYGWAWLLGLTVVVAVSAVPPLQPEFVPEEERVALWIGLAVIATLSPMMRTHPIST